MKELKTIARNTVKRETRRHSNLFKTPNEKILEVLKLVDYGRLYPEIWMDRLEEEYDKKISKICNIDEKMADSIMQLILNIIGRMAEKNFISDRAADLRELGFKKSEITKFLWLTNLLKKNSAQDQIQKVNSWRGLYAEVLPKLTSLEWAFDIRCDVEKSKVSSSLPLVLLKLEIEKSDERIPRNLIFQIDIGTLRGIVRDLTEIYRNAQVLRKYTLKPEG